MHSKHVRMIRNFQLIFFAQIRYHCLYDEIKDEHDPKEEYEFEEQAKIFIASYKAMQKKYQMLIMNQSQVLFVNYLKISYLTINFISILSNMRQHLS